MAAVRHLGFSKVGNFNCPYPSEVQNASGPKCVIMPNSVQIGRTVAEIWPFSIFQDDGSPPSWIVYVYKPVVDYIRDIGLCVLERFQTAKATFKGRTMSL